MTAASNPRTAASTLGSITAMRASPITMPELARGKISESRLSESARPVRVKGTEIKSTHGTTAGKALAAALGMGKGMGMAAAMGMDMAMSIQQSSTALHGMGAGTALVESR